MNKTDLLKLAPVAPKNEKMSVDNCCVQTIQRAHNLIIQKHLDKEKEVSFREFQIDPEIVDRVTEFLRSEGYEVEVQQTDDLFKTGLPQPCFLKISW